jgi:hypothetical protein
VKKTYTIQGQLKDDLTNVVVQVPRIRADQKTFAEFLELPKEGKAILIYGCAVLDQFDRGRLKFRPRFKINRPNRDLIKQLSPVDFGITLDDFKNAHDHFIRKGWIPPNFRFR